MDQEQPDAAVGVGRSVLDYIFGNSWLVVGQMLLFDELGSYGRQILSLSYIVDILSKAKISQLGKSRVVMSFLVELNKMFEFELSFLVGLSWPNRVYFSHIIIS